MLYKRNHTPTLPVELFQNPTAEYRGTPFWSWNCKLDKAQLLHQLEQLKEMGFGGAHMHPRTGLDTEYLSGEFMEMVTACCDKVEAEQMLAWLYDEDRWSSGPAGGLVTKHKPFRRKRLSLYTEDKGWDLPKAEAVEAGEPYLLGCYDVCLDAEGYLTSGARIGKEEAVAGTKWYAYVVNEAESTWFNGQTYIDAMDREAVRSFIDITYERYKEVIGDRFDKSVPAIFTDEPNADHEGSIALPNPRHTGRIKWGWSRFFEEEYRKAYGEDIVQRLPELLWNRRDGEDSVVKYRYFDLKARLFAENFWGQIADWCEESGIAMTGHLLREPKLMQQSICSGDNMVCYSKYQMPGIDILEAAREFTTAKQAQSAVHQYGREAMMSELYGVTGWNFDFRGHKLHGDWQAALGVTVRVPHLAWVSMKGEAKRDYPAAIGYQSPWYKEYSYIEDHFARLNTALTRGTPIVRIGVIHPVESAWLLAGPTSQNATKLESLEGSFQNVTRWLLESQLDFDFICEGLVPELKSAEDPAAMGCMRYDAVVVPGCLTLRQTTLDWLDTFRRSGGKVIFLGSCPGYVDGAKSDACRRLFEAAEHAEPDKAALASALESVRCVAIRLDDGKPDDNHIYQYRQDGDHRWLFIARSADPARRKSFRTMTYDVVDADTLEIAVNGLFTAEEYDTLTGNVKPVACTYKNGKTLINRTMHGCDSLLLRLTEGTGAELPAEAARKVLQTLPLWGPVAYTLSEPNVLLLDQARWALDDGAWQEREEILRLDNLCREILGYPARVGKLAQPYTMEPKPETHTLRLQFRFESRLRLENVRLAIEDAERLTLTLNAEPVPVSVDGWFTDESIRTLPLPAIRAGENVLEVAMPYGPRTNPEWCYLLGDFGVRIRGSEAFLEEKPEKLGFGDAAMQGLPFYGANITYHIPVEMPQDGALKLHTNAYRGALIAVELDGERVGRIVFPPYDAVLENVPAGRHKVDLTLFGQRCNCFAPLHRTSMAVSSMNPSAWRTTGDDWCYEYNLFPFGILKAPEITVLECPPDAIK